MLAARRRRRPRYYMLQLHYIHCFCFIRSAFLALVLVLLLDRLLLLFRPRLVHLENQKISKISRHIESFRTCMKY